MCHKDSLSYIFYFGSIILLLKMGLLETPVCSKCFRDQGDLIHMIWHCPKLHRYWMSVTESINSVFSTDFKLNPKSCLLGVLDQYQSTKQTKAAISRALFKARKLILQYWKSDHPPIENCPTYGTHSTP